jgi:hypothetical protein
MTKTATAELSKLPKGTTDSVLARLFPEPNKYLLDPVGWIEAHTGEFLWSKQREVAQSVADHRYTAVHSAHGTGKSFNASRIVAWWLNIHPVGEAFAVTTAPTAAQVEAILWREIRKVHDKLKRHPGIESRALGRVTLDSKWYMGGDELVAYGRKPADYDEAAFQGIHARYVLVVIDEACGVPENLYNAIDSIVTNSYARVLAIGNPDDPASHFARICQDPKLGWHVIHINGLDTPNFTDEEIPEDLRPMLTSVEWVEERKKRWGEGSPIYISKVLGEFPEVTNDTLITPAMIKRAQAIEHNDFEHGLFALDVANEGEDRTCCYRNRGGVIRKVFEHHADDTMKTAGKAKHEMDKFMNQVPLVVDAIGVGAGVLDRLLEQDCPVFAFKGSWKAREPRKYKNMRAEQWWLVREGFENGDYDLDPDDEDLASELMSIKWFLNSSGQIQVESKKELKKRGQPSPDHADAMMMSTCDEDFMDVQQYVEEFKQVKGITDDLLERAM